MSQNTIAKIAPHVTILPAVTKLNINTASAEVIWASGSGLDMSEAQRIVQSRSNQYFKSVSDAAKLLSKPEALPAGLFEVYSEYFEVRGRMRIDQTIVEERSLVHKQRGKVRTLWRERGGFLRTESADAMRPS
ncbi:type II secretion system protein GspK [Diaphorobacter aerolatus]|uniref:type II secretion system protein GspK n=1 Tax=Diaphorobacter aerolatus TaxID=1288495 RepID=UPI00299F6567|nr:type II secretion system protein GspK [Diaphorobacter aerolatus]